MSETFRVLLRNELRLYGRNRISMFWSFGFPILLLSIMLFAFGGSLGTVRVRIVDQDASPQSRAFAEALQRENLSGGGGRAAFQAQFERREGAAATAAEPLPRGAVRVLIAPGFGSALVQASAAAPGAAPRTKLTIAYDHAAALSTRAAATMLEMSMRRLLEARAPQAFPVDFDKVDVGAPGSGLSPAQYFLTGVVVMVMMSTGLVSTALALVSMRAQNTFKLYGCWPLRPAQILASIIITRALIILASILVLFGIGRYVLHLPLDLFALSTLRALSLVLCGSAMFVALGLLVAARARDVATAQLVCNVIYLPLLFLGDLTFPLNDCPDGLRHVLGLVPVKPLVNALRQVLFESWSLTAASSVLSQIVLWTALFLVCASRSFRWSYQP